MRFVTYEDPIDDLDDLDQPKKYIYELNWLLGQCGCMEEEIDLDVENNG